MFLPKWDKKDPVPFGARKEKVMELILYYIEESRNLLISFLILMFALGMFAYIAMKNFQQDKKSKVLFYGLFLRMNDIDILKLSTVVIKTFLAFYATIVTNELMIWLCLCMMAILTLIYIVCSFKRVIYQVVYTMMQMVMIYLIYIINNYMLEIEYSYVILGIKVCLIVFELMLSTYLFFRDINIIAEDRVDKNFKKEKKTENLAKGTE